MVPCTKQMGLQQQSELSETVARASNVFDKRGPADAKHTDLTVIVENKPSLSLSLTTLVSNVIMSHYMTYYIL